MAYNPFQFKSLTQMQSDALSFAGCALLFAIGVFYPVYALNNLSQQRKIIQFDLDNSGSVDTRMRAISPTQVYVQTLFPTTTISDSQLIELLNERQPNASQATFTIERLTEL